jgi:AraC-like DNA-binding protein
MASPTESSSPSAELSALIGRLTPSDGEHGTAIGPLSLFRYSRATELQCGVSRAALVLVAQGAKRVMLGGQTYEYGAGHSLVSAIDLPTSSQITLATPGRPYLCMLLALDLKRIAELIAEMPPPRAEAEPPAMGITVFQPSASLFDTVLRLVRLLETPEDIPVLAPLLERELMYRLLTGAPGLRLRHIAASDSQANKIARAIDWLKRHYDEPLRIESLAQRVNMSASSLHHHFKNVTTMSPLQYQKQLRLHEARRLLLRQASDVGSVALRVGYESASQFSREYSRLFGAPPLRDAAQLRRSDTSISAANS